MSHISSHLIVERRTQALIPATGFQRDVARPAPGSASGASPSRPPTDPQSILTPKPLNPSALSTPNPLNPSFKPPPF